MSASIADIKDRYRRYVVEVINQGNLDALGEFVAADVKWYTPAPGFTGDYEGLEAYLSMLLEAFPDFEFGLEDLVVEGDKLVARSVWTGTHRAPFLGVAATERRVRVAGLDLCRFADGKIVEHWANFDAFGLMSQLGAPIARKPDLNVN